MRVNLGKQRFQTNTLMYVSGKAGVRLGWYCHTCYYTPCHGCGKAMSKRMRSRCKGFPVWNCEACAAERCSNCQAHSVQWWQIPRVLKVFWNYLRTCLRREDVFRQDQCRIFLNRWRVKGCMSNFSTHRSGRDDGHCFF